MININKSRYKPVIPIGILYFLLFFICIFFSGCKESDREEPGIILSENGLRSYISHEMETIELFKVDSFGRSVQYIVKKGDYIWYVEGSYSYPKYQIISKTQIFGPYKQPDASQKIEDTK